MWAVLLIAKGYARTPQDVLEDLEGEELHGSVLEKRIKRAELSDELGQMGLFEREEREKFKASQRLYPIIGALVLVFGRMMTGSMDTPMVLVMAMMGLSIGYIVSRRRLLNKKAEYISDIEFYLPVIMERTVMAVQAGLDIIAAVKVVVEIDQEQSLEAIQVKKDPVTKLLEMVYSLTESGLSFEQALKDIAGLVECAALRHAFLHLAQAHIEGGELIMPLRELSDSTQLYYQESVEEDVAKMPVKATMPLLLTFTGLIIFFITAPLIEITSMTKRMDPNKVSQKIESTQSTSMRGR